MFDITFWALFFGFLLGILLGMWIEKRIPEWQLWIDKQLDIERPRDIF